MRFYRALQTLGFDPWLDQEPMTAGTVLTRGLSQGMDESCACVFFVTENFVDEKYLKHEIDLATKAQIECEEDFRILAFGIGDTATMPEALKKTWIYREHITELEALNEIVRALPLRLGEPYWPAKHL